VSGYNSIYAVGTCSGGGETTEISNQLSVFSSVSSGPSIPPGVLVEYSIQYQQPVDYFMDDETNRKQVCKNLLALSPSGTCVVNSVVAAGGLSRRLRTLLVSSGSSFVNGSVQYDNTTAGEQLFDDLDKADTSTLTTLAEGIVNSASEVSVESVSENRIPDSSEPGPPGFVTASRISTSNATISWLDGKTGTPEETYSVNCVASATGLCTDSGVEVTGIARGTQSQVMTGLSAKKTYRCWVKASNKAGEVCSLAPTIFKTLGAPDEATNVSEVSVSNTTATISWADGAEGNPTETYTVKCVVEDGGTSCTQAGENVTDIARGTQEGTVTGLTPNTAYHCYVIASNSVDDVCSTEYASVKTWIEAGPPTNVTETVVSNTTATISWVDGTAGNPEETYNVTCVSGPAPSCLSSSGISTGATGIARGTLSGTVTGLSPNTTYGCLVKAENDVGVVCSESPARITTLIAPGAPSNVQNASVSATDATITWSDGLKGNPEETYTVLCVDSGSQTCPTTSPINVTGISRGKESAIVDGLSGNTTYSCYVKASNDQGEACSSDPAVFTTDPPTMFLASNGVTVLCPNAADGESGKINGITYTKRSKTDVEAMISNDQFTKLSTTCMSGITDMARLFKKKAPSMKTSVHGIHHQ
jgi:hypothetical protein